MARKKNIVGEIKEEKKKYLQCPFCNNIQYSLNSRDPSSAWCIKCGKCFPVIWMENGRN